MSDKYTQYRIITTGGRLHFVNAVDEEQARRVFALDHPDEIREIQLWRA